MFKMFFIQAAYSVKGHTAYVPFHSEPEVKIKQLYVVASGYFFSSYLNFIENMDQPIKTSMAAYPVNIVLNPNSEETTPPIGGAMALPIS